MIGRKAERGRINSDNSIRIVTTGQHNNGVHLKQIGSMLPGRVIAHVAGSPSTAAGSNGGVTTATESQMTVSVVTMAKIMGSASTVSPWCSLAAVSAFSTAVTGLAWLIRPEYWSNDWYDSDDVYVDYNDDGYYLYNRRYPGDRISISFYLN